MAKAIRSPRRSALLSPRGARWTVLVQGTEGRRHLMVSKK